MQVMRDGESNVLKVMRDCERLRLGVVLLFDG